MTDKKTILQIEGPVASVLPGQIACEVAEDADTGARMWGGKDHAGNVSKFLVKDGIAVIKKVVGEGGLTLESEHGSVDVTEAGESALATQAQTLVGAINEVHRGGWTPPDTWEVAEDAFALAAEDAEVRTAVFTETRETYGGVAGVSADAGEAYAGVYNALEGDPGDGYAAFVRTAAENNNGTAEFVLGADNTGDAFAELWTSNGGWLVNPDGFFLATPNNNEIAIDDEDNQDGLETESQSIVGAINELNAKASTGSEALVFRSGVDLNSNNDYEASLPLPLLETGYWEIFSFRVGVSDDANLGWAVADSRWGIEDPYRYLDSLVLLIDDEAAVPYFSARGEYESLGMDSTGTRANRRPVIMRVEEGSEMALIVGSESKAVYVDFTLLARKIGDLPDPPC